MLSSSSRIFVAGHRGMVGTALVRSLRQAGFVNILTRTHSHLDLTNQQDVRLFLQNEKIDIVVLAAAKVGGIHANNTYPADFIATNLQIQTNVITESFRAGIQDLLFLGSSCIYPKNAPQPLKEEYLLTGPLEPTNTPYAIAKIAGITMCKAFNRQYGTRYFSVMPTNLYGPDDNFHLENSHVIPAMLRKYHLGQMAAQENLQAILDDEKAFGIIPEATARDIGLAPDRSHLQHGHEPRVVLWGSGNAYREFLHVEDMASACVHLMNMSTRNPEDQLINIGTGQDQTIRKTAGIIQRVVGFSGETLFDKTYPDGTPKKLLDTSRINAMGWKPKITFTKGLQDTYSWYLQQIAKSKK
ncbi:MAG: GDP-L-fucose synthase [Desulfobulbus sp.]|nr:MAG: GDP-L-fucose synthase [Desulfobulbus sp.]